MFIHSHEETQKEAIHCRGNTRGNTLLRKITLDSANTRNVVHQWTIPTMSMCAIIEEEDKKINNIP